MTALLVACAVCDDTADGGVPLDVVSSTRRRRGGSELDARLVCPVCGTVHTITVSLHVDAEHKRRHAAAMSMHSETQP